MYIYICTTYDFVAEMTQEKSINLALFPCGHFKIKLKFCIWKEEKQ